METNEKKNRSIFDRITGKDLKDDLRDTKLQLNEARIETQRVSDMAKTIVDKNERLEADNNLALFALDQINIAQMYAQDSPSRYGSYYIDPTQLSRGPVFGTSNISDSSRLFGSQREPIVIWYIVKMAIDMFDNWFKIVEVGKEDDDTLDNAVQKVLDQLNAKQELTRAFIFERRYGTASILYSFTKTNDNEEWKTPVYEINEEGTRKYNGSREIVAITPYPKTKFSIASKDTDETSIRLGQPLLYKFSRGSLVNPIEAHYSRVNKIATQIDEDPIWGVSRVDGIYDDSTGYRNLRWAQYQAWWRMGTGFAHMKFPQASREDIKRWIADGYFNEIFTRSYFISGKGGEEIDFKGLQGSLVNPAPFNDTALHNLSMATGIPKNLLIGAQAGTLSGSTTNLTAYAKLISGEQELAEPFVRQFIDILMDLGQIDFDRNNKSYKVIWAPTFELSESEQVKTAYTQELVYEKMLNYRTVNEVRALNELGEVEGGDIVPGLIYKLLRGQPGGTSEPGKEALQFGPNSLKSDKVEKPNTSQITLLDDELAELLMRIKYDETTHDEAMNEAKVIIEKHVNETRDSSLQRLGEITGQQLTVESPESQIMYDELTAHYLSFFEKQLTDILKQRAI